MFCCISSNIVYLVDSQVHVHQLLFRFISIAASFSLLSIVHCLIQNRP